MRVRAYAALAIGLLISACSGVASGPVPTLTPVPLKNGPTATLVPLPTLAGTVDPNCPVGDLATWLQYTSPNLKSYVEKVNASAKITPDQANDLMFALARYRGQITPLTVPNCAADEAKLIFTLMDGSFNAINDFAQHKRQSIANDVALMNVEYAQIQQRQKQLTDLLAVLYGQGKH